MLDVQQLMCTPKPVVLIQIFIDWVHMIDLVYISLS